MTQEVTIGQLGQLTDSQFAIECVEGPERSIALAAARHQYGFGAIYSSAIPAIKKEGTLRCWRRPLQYLNTSSSKINRAVKRRVNAKQAFREFQAARRTIQAYEAINMIRKGQVRWESGANVRRQIRFINQLFDLVV